MEVRPRGYQKVERLLAKGADIPNPLSLDIGDEVDVERISGEGVVLYPGCRIYGAKTVISAGGKLGAEGPVTLDDCRLGPQVELKGGSFKKAVFLEKANMGRDAQVREGTLLEEEANGAHCVGLKQTILFPFVTLGSLINFCDCFMAGGTSRKGHSEVGSSYIHFNFTPDGNKTTASLFGDVPRGVMLDQPLIFLGGQGGAVGPLRVAYGTVVAAGSILRRDVLEEGKLVVVGPHPGLERDFTPHAHRQLKRTLANNLLYLANLVALEQWYRQVRRPFFAAQELGSSVYEGALEMLALAKEERMKRLLAMAEKAPAGSGATPDGDRGLRDGLAAACTVFEEEPPDAGGEAFLEAFASATGGSTARYIETIQGLPREVAAQGTEWLQRLVYSLYERAGTELGLPHPADKRS
jgi:bifunctional UDP-N-acetylglucosamine pyrophosphorylase / glucosamine-1-phosphate N-acetyltransferase